jgi:hypothetical protein
MDAGCVAMGSTVLAALGGAVLVLVVLVFFRPNRSRMEDDGGDDGDRGSQG